jgi:hypothetical protein
VCTPNDRAMVWGLGCARLVKQARRQAWQQRREHDYKTNIKGCGWVILERSIGGQRCSDQQGTQFDLACVVILNTKISDSREDDFGNILP